MVSEQVDLLFATSEQCELSLADHLVTITFPDAWSTNEASEAVGLVACVWFGPDELDIPEPLTRAPEGVAVTVGSVGGPATFPYEWISRKETLIAGRPGWRVEESVPLNDPTRETLQLVYWVSLESNPAGPTLVARTATEEAGSYELNKAVLDRMMASLVIK